MAATTRIPPNVSVQTMAIVWCDDYHITTYLITTHTFSVIGYKPPRHKLQRDYNQCDAFPILQLRPWTRSVPASIKLTTPSKMIQKVETHRVRS